MREREDKPQHAADENLGIRQSLQGTGMSLRSQPCRGCIRLHHCASLKLVSKQSLCNATVICGLPCQVTALLIDASVLGLAVLLCYTGSKCLLSVGLCSVALTREEVQLAEALLKRVAKLAAAASATGVKLMIDAEHTYFQPVSHRSCTNLHKFWNRLGPMAVRLTWSDQPAVLMESQMLPFVCK